MNKELKFPWEYETFDSHKWPGGARVEYKRNEWSTEHLERISSRQVRKLKSRKFAAYSELKKRKIAYELQKQLDNRIKYLVLEEKRFDIFCKYVLGLDVEDVHLEMINFLESTTEGLLLASRDFGKSTICTQAACLFRMVLYPNERTLVISANQTQAEKQIGGIKAHIETNSRFRRLFGDIKGDIWSKKELSINTRTKFWKEATLTAVGLSSATIVGWHGENVILDDILNLDNTRTQLQRERVTEYFYQVVLPTLEPGGRMFVIGTRYAVSDFYGHLLANEFANNHTIIPLLREDADGNEYSTYPNKFPLKKALSRRKRMGAVMFNMQYQNQVNVEEGAIFSYDWFSWFTDRPNDMRIYISIDPAISQGKNSDFFASIVAGVTRDRDVYILDYYRNKMPFPTQIKTILDWIKKFEPHKVFVESVAFQSAISQTLLTHKIAKGRVVPVISKFSKEARAHKVAPMVEQRRVYLPDSFRRDKPRFIEEVIRFPDIDHDDVCDAFIQLLDAVFFGSRKKSRTVEPGLL